MINEMSMNNWAIGGLVLGAAAYYVMTRETKLERLKKQGDRAARKVTIDHFVKLIRNDPSITLDNAILDFEEAKTNDLDEFAKSKGRTKRVYEKAYREFFDQAKCELIFEQKKLETFAKKKV
jgi:hypothetical protein